MCVWLAKVSNHRRRCCRRRRRGRCGNRHATDAALLEIMAMVMVFANRFIFHYLQWQQALSSALIGQCQRKNGDMCRTPVLWFVVRGKRLAKQRAQKKGRSAQW